MKFLNAIDMVGNAILNLKAPVTGTDGANKAYVDSQGLRGSQGYAMQRTRLTSVSPSAPDGTSFVDVDPALDLTVNAIAGDIVELNFQALVQNQPATLNINSFTMVGTGRVNRVEPGTVAPSGWGAAGGGIAYLAGSFQYAVKAADLTTGTVKFRLVASVTSTGYPATRNMYGCLFACRNLG